MLNSSPSSLPTSRAHLSDFDYAPDRSCTYAFDPDTANHPSFTNSGWGLVEYQRGDPKAQYTVDWTVQIVYPHADHNCIWYRHYINGVWEAWKCIDVSKKVKFSRYMRWEWNDNAQSGSHTCSFTSIFAGTPGNLADNEFISSVQLHSHGNAYSNSAIAFLTEMSYTSSALTVAYYRDSNDNSNELRCFAIVCKFE